MTLERFNHLPPELERGVQPIPESEEDERFHEDYEKGEVILTNVLNMFQQKTRGHALSDEDKRILFREIVNLLEDEEKHLLLQILEREI